jgi:hypothetical protein
MQKRAGSVAIVVDSDKGLRSNTGFQSGVLSHCDFGNWKQKTAFLVYHARTSLSHAAETWLVGPRPIGAPSMSLWRKKHS